VENGVFLLTRSRRDNQGDRAGQRQPDHLHSRQLVRLDCGLVRLANHVVTVCARLLRRGFLFDIACPSKLSQLIASGEIMGIFGLSQFSENHSVLTRWRSSPCLNVKLCYVICGEAWKGKTIRSLFTLFSGAKMFATRLLLAAFPQRPNPAAPISSDRSVVRSHPARKYYFALPKPKVKNLRDLKNIFTRPSGGILNRL
jgi:hypothetical protein